MEQKSTPEQSHDLLKLGVLVRKLLKHMKYYLYPVHLLQYAENDLKQRIKLVEHERENLTSATLNANKHGCMY